MEEGDKLPARPVCLTDRAEEQLQQIEQENPGARKDLDDLLTALSRGELDASMVTRVIRGYDEEAVDKLEFHRGRRVKDLWRWVTVDDELMGIEFVLDEIQISLDQVTLLEDGHERTYGEFRDHLWSFGPVHYRSWSFEDDLYVIQISGEDSPLFEIRGEFISFDPEEE